MDHDGCGNRQSPAASWPENGWKKGEIAKGVAASPAAIEAMVAVVGSLKMEITAR